MKAVIHIGNTKEDIISVQKAVMQVVNSPAADIVKVEELKAMAQALNISNVSITNCTISTYDH